MPVSPVDFIVSILILAALIVGGFLFREGARWLQERDRPAQDDGPTSIQTVATSTNQFMATVTGRLVEPKTGSREDSEMVVPTLSAAGATEFYLVKNPPAVSQFHTSRRADVRVIVLHTAENRPDTVGIDEGAEGVARFISRRGEAGSYHTIVDSDSRVRLGPYTWTMFHCRDFNSPSLGLSWATKASEWDSLPDDYRMAMFRRAAIEAADMCQWVYATYGYVIPATFLTKGEAESGQRGLTFHSTMDPARRSDPNLSPDEQALFLDLYESACLDLGLHVQINRGVVPPMPTIPSSIEDHTRLLQQRLVSSGHDIGSTGPLSNGVDGEYGRKTAAALVKLVDGLLAENKQLSSRVSEQDEEIGRLRSQPGQVLSSVDAAKIAYVDAMLAQQHAKAALQGALSE